MNLCAAVEYIVQLSQSKLREQDTIRGGFKLGAAAQEHGTSTIRQMPLFKVRGWLATTAGSGESFGTSSPK